jgi:hypothetical protein
MANNIKGRVISVNVKGRGPNSAQLLFVVEDESKAEKRALVVGLEYEPQLFSAMASFVIAAYSSQEKIKVGYQSKTGETDHAVEISTSS